MHKNSKNSKNVSYSLHVGLNVRTDPSKFCLNKCLKYKKVRRKVVLSLKDKNSMDPATNHIEPAVLAKF